MTNTLPGVFTPSQHSDVVSTSEWSKNPDRNNAIDGLFIGTNAPHANILPAIRATMAGVAGLVDKVGGSSAPQFDDVYQFRKYEGDADCVLVLKPFPMVYTRSTAQPAPTENLPYLVRDALGRAWAGAGSGGVTNVFYRSQIAGLAGAGLPENTVVFADGLGYMQVPGSTVIPDLPGWEPIVGTACTGHWGVIGSDTIVGATTDYTAELRAAVQYRGDLAWEGWASASKGIQFSRHCRVDVKGGRDCGGFVAQTDFDLTEPYLIRPGEGVGSHVGHFSIYCHQPSSATTLAGLVKYPTAWEISEEQHGTVDQLRISNAWDGVIARGNAGGYDAGNLQLGCFNENCVIDGPLDFVDIKKLHVWPFGIVGLPGVLDDFYANTVALYVGKCDGLHINHLASFRGRIELAGGVQFNPYQIDAIALDGDGAELQLTGGKSQISKVYTTKSTSNDGVASIVCSAGLHDISSLVTAEGQEAHVQVTGGHLDIDHGHVTAFDNAQPVAEVSGGSLRLGDGLSFNHAGIRTAPYVIQTGGILKSKADTLVRNPASFAAGVPAIQVQADNYHHVDGRCLRPHTIQFPAGSTTGIYEV